MVSSSRVRWSRWKPGSWFFHRRLGDAGEATESQTGPQSAHLHFWEGSSNAGLPVNNGRPFGGLFARTAGCFSVAFRFPNSGEPTHCFVLADSISGYFGDTLSLVRKTLYTHPAYLRLFSSFSLISHQPLLLAGYRIIHRKLVIFPASLFPVSLGDGVCDSFLNPYTPPFKGDEISVIYSQIKALNGPLFCASAGSSIWPSFRGMKLIRKGQRASRLLDARGRSL